jgi:hypothetical protein
VNPPGQPTAGIGQDVPLLATLHEPVRKFVEVVVELSRVPRPHAFSKVAERESAVSLVQCHEDVQSDLVTHEVQRLVRREAFDHHLGRVVSHEAR